ncbi:MAG: MFS transporter [Kineosporiaceae bacterium]|nr:MFS transporter [Kineosporiaceae bacterium]
MTDIRTVEADVRRIHRAWLVAAVTLGALVTAAAFRSSIGVLIEPLEQEFGWTRATTSGAVTLNLVLYGLVAPFAAALMERWGIRRVVALALTLVGGASALTLLMTAAWQLWLLWGLLIGVGTGSMALVFGAIVANRWFEARRGLVTGIFSAGNATGQLIFLPVVARAVEGPGWRWAAAGIAVYATLMIALVLAFLDDHPSDRGLLPYGAAPTPPPPPSPPPPPPLAPLERNVTLHSSGERDVTLRSGGMSAMDDGPPTAATQRDSTSSTSAVRTALGVLAESSRRWTFWALALTFFVCGWSTNGLVQTHFVPAAHDHGMPTTTAAGLLAVVGIFDIIGTLASGWLTDRMDSRVLLAAYYGLRGVSLLVVHQMLAPSVEPSLWVFIVFYGLDWVATVPPTVALCRQHFGLQRSGVVFGWVFASHMVGAGIGASVAGWIRTSSGSYHDAWIIAAELCFAAAVVSLSIRRSQGVQSSGDN